MTFGPRILHKTYNNLHTALGNGKRPEDCNGAAVYSFEHVSRYDRKAAARVPIILRNLGSRSCGHSWNWLSYEDEH